MFHLIKKAIVFQTEQNFRDQMVLLGLSDEYDSIFRRTIFSDACHLCGECYNRHLFVNKNNSLALTMVSPGVATEALVKTFTVICPNTVVLFLDNGLISTVSQKTYDEMRQRHCERITKISVNSKMELNRNTKKRHKRLKSNQSLNLQRYTPDASVTQLLNVK